jgi:hypothetical protein
MSPAPGHKSFLGLFFKKEQRFFFEKKTQKTFTPFAGGSASA